METILIGYNKTKEEESLAIGSPFFVSKIKESTLIYAASAAASSAAVTEEKPSRNR